MAAHLTRDACGPPPPTRNEVLLREAVDRLRLQLDAARKVAQETRAYLSGYSTVTDLQHAVDIYDKAMGGK